MTQNEPIGYIIGGGLKEGFRIRLTVPADQVQEGSFLVCDNGRFRYYGLVTDLQLGATDPRFADEKTDRMHPAIQSALLGKTLYTTLEMYPTLLMDRGPDDPREYMDWQDRVQRGEETPGPKPVKTVPAHHANVRPADESDVAEIFGKEGKGMFVVGHTIEQGYPVRLDLNKLVKRSSGIFGATGTGKSFLTRMILAGLMKENVAASLVFDMHNEYAFDVEDSDNTGSVKGLRSLFGSQVQVATLAGEKVRGHSPDFDLFLRISDFTAKDILLLSNSLNLTDTAPVILAALEESFKERWFEKFMDMIPNKTEEYETETGRIRKKPAPDSVEYWAEQNNVHPMAATSLHSKLKQQIFNKDYVRKNLPNDPVTAIVDKLENGRHLILSFGRYDNDLDYLLVSNILTRRIRDKWVEKTEQSSFLGIAPPRPLLITIEEAHKLLNPQLAGQTAFGIIARELRKYFVTLLVVDQRPSGIDDEIMSQLGTRITGWLGDEDDIRAVLTGLAGRDQLRGMLARLQEKEEVLLLGWGVKMPIPVKSRRYDERFYDAIKGRAESKPSSLLTKPLDDLNDDLFG